MHDRYNICLLNGKQTGNLGLIDHEPFFWTVLQCGKKAHYINLHLSKKEVAFFVMGRMLTTRYMVFELEHPL